MNSLTTLRKCLSFCAVASLILLTVSCPAPGGSTGGGGGGATTYTITYDGNGNTGGTVPVDNNRYSIGYAIVMGNTGNLVKTGYSFSGWNTMADGSGTTFTAGQSLYIGSANVILYATWGPPTYTVTYDRNGSTGGTVAIDTTNYVQGQKVTVLGNTGSLVKTGFSFSGWNTNADGSGTTFTAGQTFTMSNVSVTLYAKWASIPNFTEFVFATDYNSAANYGGFIFYSLNTNTGALTEIQTFAGYDTPPNIWECLAADSTSNAVYGAEIKGLYQFGVLPTGFFGLGADVPTGLQGVPMYVAVDRTGNYVFVVYYNASGGNVAVYTNASLYEEQGSVAAGANPSSVAADPVANFVYVTNKGDNTVSAFRYDPDSGQLTPVSISPAYPAGTAPFRVAVDPTGKFVYVANNGSANISAYTINSINGSLTQMSGSPFAAGTNPCSVVVDPTGKFLYLANHGSSNISAYTIDPVTGALAPVSGSPFAAGNNGPSCIVTDPMGKFLYEADSTVGNNIFVYKINPSTGVLTPVSGSVCNQYPTLAGFLCATYLH